MKNSDRQIAHLEVNSDIIDIGKLLEFPLTDIHIEFPAKKERKMSDEIKVEDIKIWLHNVRYFPHKMMAKFLRKRGWVVFYLEEQSRECKGVCWLDAYKSTQHSEEKKNAKRF